MLGVAKTPNLNNQFIRCQTSGRQILNQQIDSIKSHVHSINITSASSGAHTHTISAFTVSAVTNTTGNHSHTIAYTEGSANGSGVSYESAQWSAVGTHDTSTAGNHSHTIDVNIPLRTTSTSTTHTHDVVGSSAATGDTETRPMNTMLYAIIKATNS